MRRSNWRHCSIQAARQWEAGGPCKQGQTQDGWSSACSHTGSGKRRSGQCASSQGFCGSGARFPGCCIGACKCGGGEHSAAGGRIGAQREGARVCMKSLRSSCLKVPAWCPAPLIARSARPCTTQEATQALSPRSQREVLAPGRASRLSLTHRPLQRHHGGPGSLALGQGGGSKVWGPASGAGSPRCCPRQAGGQAGAASDRGGRAGCG